MFTIVPFEEFGAPFRRNAVPDRDDGLSRKAHAFPRSVVEVF
jgi:hypothetical protein